MFFINCRFVFPISARQMWYNLSQNFLSDYKKWRSCFSVAHGFFCVQVCSAIVVASLTNVVWTPCFVLLCVFCCTQSARLSVWRLFWFIFDLLGQHFNLLSAYVVSICIYVCCVIGGVIFFIIVQKSIRVKILLSCFPTINEEFSCDLYIWLAAKLLNNILLFY